jgi:hypothetical protein
MARNHVHRIINLLNEFGPDYFELAQLTRISPETYRAILPALHDKSLHVDGEAIALIPANAARISAAVAQLRKAAAPPELPEASEKERLAAVDKRCSEVLAELTDMVNRCQMPHQLSGILTGLQTRLTRLQLML